MLREQKTYLEIAEADRRFDGYDQPCQSFPDYGNDGYDMVFERIDKDEEQKRRLILWIV